MLPYIFIPFSLGDRSDLLALLALAANRA